MNSTQNLLNIQNQFSGILEKYPVISQCLHKIWENNGIAYLVGGAVRDILMGLEINDLDIEVHNINPETLFDLLKKITEVNYVGKSFGVIKMAHTPVDWSLPRSDSSGRKPLVTINPNMPIEEALKRRDLTMNAMAINLKTYELIDPFNGYKHMQEKILSSPDVSFFVEDPLRFYRIMQFMGRFDMQPDKALEDACKNINISNVSIERKEQEFDKLMLKSKKPSIGLRWLKKIDRLKEILPELYKTIGVEQDPIWHPEGDVFEHSMQALDASATINLDNNKDKLTLMYSALCHDLGKVNTTKKINGRIHSYGHEVTGAILAASMMRRITTVKYLIDRIKILVRHHMAPGQLVKQNASLAAYKRLANKLSPLANLDILSELAYADISGRNGTGDLTIVEKFKEFAQKAHVFYKPEEPILTGRDILDIIKPGPKMGKLLKFIYIQQIEAGIKDKETLKKIAIAHVSKI